MMTRLVFPLAAGLAIALSGCCSKVTTEFADRDVDEEWGSDLQICGIFAGYGTTDPEQRMGAVYTPISAAEFATTVCRGVDPGDYATCLNGVNSFYAEADVGEIPMGGATAGPFALALGPDVYLGTYRSDPFRASFEATGDAGSCRGGYSAFAGDEAAVLDVTCEPGGRGRADIVLGRRGRNGIGAVWMDDGREGRILFGHAAIRGAVEVRSQMR